MLNALLQDLRYALRMLWSKPGFSVAAMLTLALGIGANSAIFSVIDAVLLRPLAYAHPGELVSFRENQSAPDLDDVAAANHTFVQIGGEANALMAWTGGETPEQLAVGQVTGGFFAALGVGAALGRSIEPTDDAQGGPFVVVLSHTLWQERFGADPAVVGRKMQLADYVYTIIGVMPAGFVSPQTHAQAWTPAHVSNDGTTSRDVHFLRTIARLVPGVSIEQAGAEMAVIDRQLAERYPAENRNRHTELVPLKERVVGKSRGALLVLFAAVCLVLLIACANFANLLLARACEREREVAVRMALGAGRTRLVRQLLVESVLIALAGGALGALLAWIGTRALVALQPDGLPRLGEIGVDPRVFAFTLAVALLTGVVFGLYPAWAAARAGGVQPGASRGASAGRAQQKMRSTFVVAQLALALVLLVGAGLLVRTFWNLRGVDPGFQAAQLLTFRVELSDTRYRTIAEQTRFRTAALDALGALPGARAAMVSELPLSGESLDHDFLVEGWPPVAPGDEPSVETRSVIGDYFAVMGIPLRGGRDFAATDFNADAPLVGIANEALVRKYFPGEDPIGKRVRWAREDAPHWITIAGVVGDVHHFGLDQPDLPALYSPYPQTEPWKRWMTFVVRTRFGSAGAGAGGEAGDLDNRFAAAGHQAAHDARGRCRVVRGAPLRDAAAGAVRRACGDARGDRRLRRDRLHGRAAHARDRRARRGRRAHARRRAPRPGRRLAPRAARHRHRTRWRLRRDAADVRHALWRHTGRPGDPGGRRHRAPRDRPVRMLAAGPARRARRSDRSVALRMKLTQKRIKTGERKCCRH